MGRLEGAFKASLAGLGASACVIVASCRPTAGTADAGEIRVANTVDVSGGNIPMVQVSSATPPQATPPQATFERFFYKVERHLMATPPSSEAVLTKALAGRPPRDPEGAWGALLEARSGEGLPWRSEFRPPASTPYVAFPMENGACDTIRARYSRGHHLIHIAESSYLYSVTLSGFREDPSARPIDRAWAASRLLFRDEADFSFIQISEEGSLPAFGRQDPNKRWFDELRTHWHDSMQWWVDKDVIGFITVKGNGMLTQEFGISSNRRSVHWFKP